MEVMNTNVNAMKDMTERDANMSVLQIAEFMEIVQLQSTKLLVLNNGNAFVLITLQVSFLTNPGIYFKYIILGPECTEDMCLDVDCGIFDCIRGTCNICDANPCYNGGTCSIITEAGIQACFIQIVDD